MLAPSFTSCRHFPTSAAGFANLPTVSVVVPNAFHNTHGSNEAPYTLASNDYDTLRHNADTWLQGFLEPKLSNANFITRTAVVVIFDENSGTSPNQVEPQNPANTQSGVARARDVLPVGCGIKSTN